MSDELRDQFREFKTSVVHELDQQARRLTEMGDDLRRRIQTAETATVNEIRQASLRHETEVRRVREDLGTLRTDIDGLHGRFDRLERLIGGAS